MTDKHQFIITSLDLHTINLEPYQYSGTNITGIRMVNPESPLTVQVTNSIAESKINNGEDVLEGLGASSLRLQSALVYDGILLLSAALNQLKIEQIKPKRLQCNNDDSWENGHSIANFMRMVCFSDNT